MYYSTVAGGERNIAGNEDSFYSLVGGGKRNFSEGDKGTISGGGNNILESLKQSEEQGEENIGSTISGGSNNRIDNLDRDSSFSVITGGGGPEIENGGSNTIFSKESTISGGNLNQCTGDNSVVTGGQINQSGGKGSVVMGGQFNDIPGLYSVAVGGRPHFLVGDYSIAMGTNTFSLFDSSMVVNLVEDVLFSTKDGQFLMKAESFRFQIGNGNNKNGDISSFKITDENINRLIEALA